MLALTIFTCGCSTIRTVSLPGDEPAPGEREDTDQVAGTILKITDVGVSLREKESLVENEIEDRPVEATPLTTVPRDERTLLKETTATIFS